MSHRRNYPIYNGQNGAGNWRRRGPPKTPAETQQYFCEICHVSCVGDQSYQAHLVGKAHRKKEDVATGRKVLDSALAAFVCEVCNATCTGKDAYMTHINGVKHSRAIKNLQNMGRPVPESALPGAQLSTERDPMENLPVQAKVVGVTTTKFVGGMKLSSTGGEEGALEARPEDADAEPIGEEFLEPLIGGGKKTSYRCKLCLCVCGDSVAKGLHIRGRRHRLAYRQKVDPSLIVDTKKGYNALQQQPSHVQSGGFFGGAGNGAGMPLRMQSGPCNFVIPITMPFDSFDERHIRARLEELRPDAAQIATTERLVSLVERTLKSVSSIHVNAETSNEDSRLLRGVVRVGPLGEGLLIKDETVLDTNLMCKDWPTASLLQQIVDEFPNHVDDEDLRAKIELETNAEQCKLSVRLSGQPQVCNVTLTSIAVQNAVSQQSCSGDSAGGEQVASAVEKPADALPEAPCLRALADFRHTKFYQSQCAPTPNLTELVVLVRDIRMRIETWTALSLYAIELMALKLLASQPPGARLSDAFRRFFEVLSAGVYLGVKRNLVDPCDKDASNVLDHLTPRQCENLACSAQHALRLIAYDQIYVVLGCSPLDTNNETRKRPADPEPEPTNAVEDETKKPKTSPPGTPTNTA